MLLTVSCSGLSAGRSCHTGQLFYGWHGAGALVRYGRLKLIHEPEKGQNDAFNKGFRMVTGDIIGCQHERVLEEVYMDFGHSLSQERVVL